jgi:hypothetical protein
VSLIYLAGPITGLTYEGATDWREFVSESLASLSDDALDPIQCLSPMRHKDYLLGELVLKDDYPDGHTITTGRCITARDRYDATRCDLLLVNFLGAEKVSIGTVLEIAWADSVRVPIVLAIEDEGNLHDHAMVRELCPFRVNSLEKAIDMAYRILVP